MSDSEILPDAAGKDEDGICGDVIEQTKCPGGAGKKNPNYPIKVIYCPECSRPLEYCEYAEDYAACLQTIHDKLPDIFNELNLSLDMAKGSLILLFPPYWLTWVGVV